MKPTLRAMGPLTYTTNLEAIHTREGPHVAVKTATIGII